MSEVPRTPSSDRLSGYLKKLEDTRVVQVVGRVRSITGLVIKATAANARIGDLVTIMRKTGPLQAEVVGLQDEVVTLLPYGETTGIGPDSEVSCSGQGLTVRVGDGLFGRVLNGIGELIDDGPPVDSSAWAASPVLRSAPNPLRRRRIDRRLCLGVRAIDGLMTVGEGQRIGLFAGAGVGKSSLLGQIARATEAEIVVICLVGERGREVKDFIEESLGQEGVGRSIVVAATSDEPPMMRLRSAHTATAVAEHYRDRGARVLLMMDSLTRFARAQRDVGLAAGELPARQGYPPSVFSALPLLLERSGNGDRGSITAIYTVLVAGDDLHEPIADEVKGILDGHIVLDRRLAERGHWPAIDVLQSLSRVMNRLIDEEHGRAARDLRRMLSVFESKRDLIALGAYKKGSDPEVDEAIAHIHAIEEFLQQGLHQRATWDDTVNRLVEVTAT
jgi:ATP synthase in type III secretion protein N